MMLKLFTLAALVAAAPVAVPVTVVDVLDGDTFVIAGEWAVVAAAPARKIQFRIPGTVKVRVLGIDTPELPNHSPKCPEEGALGLKAKAYAGTLFGQAGMRATLSGIGFDKYAGRLDAVPTITLDKQAQDFRTKMIEAGFAKPYTGEGPKPDWCAIIKQGV